MVEVRETADRIEIVSPTTPGTRIVLGFLALVPLLAPYELLLKVKWPAFAGPFFWFAAIVSAGALAVSAVFAVAAIAGASKGMTFDATRSTFTHSAVAPVVPQRVQVFPFSSVERVEVRTTEWSDGPPSHRLTILLSDGTTFDSGSSTSREEIERARDRIEAFLSRRVSPVPNFQ